MLPETLAQALNTKSLILLTSHRPVESDALIEKALSVALAADRHGAALRAYFNLAERQADAGGSTRRSRPTGSAWPTPAGWATSSTTCRCRPGRSTRCSRWAAGTRR